MNSGAIGVFDSGLGGLTVVHELREQLPNEQIIYLGDTLRCPYGSRSIEAIRHFTAEVTNFLLQKNVKMIVVACNTVSSVALDVVEKLAGKIPVLGVVQPGCEAAVHHSADKKIGIIGTRATISAGAYGRGIRAIDKDITVYEKACPLLVPLVEEGFTNPPVVDIVLEEYLDELIDYGIDSLVLGCTHYPLISNAIHRVLGGRIEVIDSAWWSAREAKSILKEGNLLSDKKSSEDHFYATDMTDQFQRIASNFLRGDLAKIEEVVL
jgi:glutamate racemase